MQLTAAQESRVRRIARRLGYTVRKSRKRTTQHQGRYMLLNSRGACVFGSWYNATLDQIEAFLK